MITPQTVVIEILHGYPQTIPVFFNHHMLCVGCAMSGFDTLEEVAANYGISVDVFLNELTNEIRLP
jgi:hybrid cluster-associated redox disulfide protein